MLERILRNLLGNALRYTLQGGVLLAARARAGGISCEVWDTGIGIARAYERAVAEADELRTSIRQLFAQHSPQGGLQIRSALAFDVFAQGLVNERLVVSTAFYPIPKPLDDVRVEANGDPLLGRLDDRSAFAVGKIVLVTHGSASLVVSTPGGLGWPRRDDTGSLFVRLGVNHDQDTPERIAAGQDETLLVVMIGIFHWAG